MTDKAQFSALPTELRLRIWGEALSAQSVVAVTNDKDHYGINITSLGPAPSRVGGACFESRDVLRRLYAKPLIGPRKPGHGPCWVDLENTMLYLRGYEELARVLDIVPAEELKRFRHVALGFAPYTTINLACERLSAACPALRTLVMFWDPTANPPPRDLTPGAAARLATFIKSDGPFQGEDVPGSISFGIRMLGSVFDPLVKLHAVTLDQAERLEL